MGTRLIPHPETPSTAAFAVEATAVRRTEGILLLEFRVTGPIGALLVPPPAPSARGDHLWRHTCFEAFVRTSERAYVELNLSPSGEWAAYRFAAHRSRMCNAPVSPPTVEMSAAEDGFQLRASIDLSGTDLAPEMAWRVGLSVVMEETDGTKSYWALAHPAGSPDFHHDDCFALELPPPS